MVPAVEYLISNGKRVSHFFFKSRGNDLRKACWDHFYFEDIIPKLVP